jgi:hypothetical protein
MLRSAYAYSTFLDQNPPFDLRPENGIPPSTKASPIDNNIDRYGAIDAPPHLLLRHLALRAGGKRGRSRDG